MKIGTETTCHTPLGRGQDHSISRPDSATRIEGWRPDGVAVEVRPADVGQHLAAAIGDEEELGLDLFPVAAHHGACGLRVVLGHRGFELRQIGNRAVLRARSDRRGGRGTPPPACPLLRGRAASRAGPAGSLPHSPRTPPHLWTPRRGVPWPGRSGCGARENFHASHRRSSLKFTSRSPPSGGTVTGCGSAPSDSCQIATT